jgi:hypothetical protein
MRNVNAAVAQITCRDGKIDENLARASQMAKAADLILLSWLEFEINTMLVKSTHNLKSGLEF